MTSLSNDNYSAIFINHRHSAQLLRRELLSVDGYIEYKFPFIH